MLGLPVLLAVIIIVITAFILSKVWKRQKAQVHDIYPSRSEESSDFDVDFDYANTSYKVSNTLETNDGSDNSHHCSDSHHNQDYTNSNNEYTNSDNNNICESSSNYESNDSSSYSYDSSSSHSCDSSSSYDSGSSDNSYD
ncbi:hypothetical protein [Calothrix sp. UHCC 0171]|uniref:hypothetical protein n=1 Tax=Calothrix sp. UHCC 0171 TaxID=3110245 RepID=UPI002B203EDA|nr:hypothetical protein [Calothrix sp. UHCC 0171]MEA5573219.1 hypothetical protein [Calothrix sp. UHCC 0171]